MCIEVNFIVKTFAACLADIGEEPKVHSATMHEQIWPIRERLATYVTGSTSVQVSHLEINTANLSLCHIKTNIK